MEKRIDLQAVEPNAYKPMMALEQYIQQSQIPKNQLELIKIRASQINGCAYCLDLHTKDAISLGESPQRIFLLNAWRETELYTAQERIVLAITEEITLIHDKGLSAATYAQASEVFNEQYIAQLIMAVICINAWNRIAISTLKPL